MSTTWGEEDIIAWVSIFETPPIYQIPRSMGTSLISVKPTKDLGGGMWLPMQHDFVVSQGLGPTNCQQDFCGYGFISGIPPDHGFSAIFPNDKLDVERGAEMEMQRGKSKREDTSKSSKFLGGHHKGTSCSEEHSSNSNDPQPPPANRKPYQRYSDEQIENLEQTFDKCKYPDDEQCSILSQQLGLKPRQVKSWFANRRNQEKVQNYREENMKLRIDNENLKAVNIQLKSAMCNVDCLSGCRSEIKSGILELLLENARLKEKLKQLESIIAQHCQNQASNLTGPQLLPL